MVATTILRFQKKHAWGQITQASNHNSRKTVTDNVDQSRSHLNRFLIGRPDDNVAAICQTMINPDRKIRKDAVLGVVGLISASPAYFRPSNPAEAGAFETEKLEPWVEASLTWLKNKYERRLVQAVLHLDEVTPHIHFILLPLDDKGHLNCKALFGGNRKRLSMIQTEYHGAVQHLGIERGLEGSTATHQTVRQIYSTIMNAKNATAPTMPSPDNLLSDPPGIFSRNEENIKTWAARALAAQEESVRGYFMGLAARAALAERQAAVLKKHNTRINAEIKKAEADKAQVQKAFADINDQVKQMTAALRDLDIRMVLKKMFQAESLGGDKSNLDIYKLPDGDVVRVNHSQSGEVWATSKKLGKGAINLVMDLAGYAQNNYKQAVRDLAEVFGDEETIRALAGYLADSARGQLIDLKARLIPTPAARKAARAAKWAEIEAAEVAADKAAVNNYRNDLAEYQQAIQNGRSEWEPKAKAAEKALADFDKTNKEPKKVITNCVIYDIDNPKWIEWNDKRNPLVKKLNEAKANLKMFPATDYEIEEKFRDKNYEKAIAHDIAIKNIQKREQEKQNQDKTRAKDNQKEKQTSELKQSLSQSKERGL